MVVLAGNEKACSSHFFYYFSNKVELTSVWEDALASKLVPALRIQLAGLFALFFCYF